MTVLPKAGIMKAREAKMKLSDIYNGYTDLASDVANRYGEGFIPADLSYQILYNLLDARYGARSIATSSSTVFKSKVCAIIFQYAPTWWKSLNIQKELRNLTEEDLMRGALQVSSQALNPSDVPSGNETGLDTPIIKTINAQTTSQYRKSKLDAYNGLLLLLRQDVTNEFIGRFKGLFKLVTLGPEPTEEEA